MGWEYGWSPYVSVGQRRAQGLLEMEKLRKKGLIVQPVRIDGRKIATTFWGQAWCGHLEKFSDFASRLPRGRTYVRNGSVCHLEMQKGKIVAKVSGSEVYDVEIGIKPLSTQQWSGLKERCGGRVGSLLELLSGRLSTEVMTVVTDKEQGLFPLPDEIELDCSCPDWADMCKHVAAVLYGVGARLDTQPELLFLLRNVDHSELVGAEAAAAVVSKSGTSGRRTLDEGSISDVFGIDLTTNSSTAKNGAVTKSNTATKALPARKTRAKRKAATGKVSSKTSTKADAGMTAEKRGALSKRKSH